ncbi:hypothetical protein COU87_00855 [Candidatus Roizmanbacteria bacterium CG10_big_fil_rev_8_21_14_0_10_39_12]|uniref:Uncharacterized protein n=1 Tax=Candidatus Roizmanbacteria bacterium CG10_big_fil_rev_8_21_14_0_10_39_12 TaxID=1974852 RepID=A0A2M8KQH3_9BACT|nr:MAG: hypothetical protein COY15_00660 [Candidatus Roizmanbacteria bacterium CG_4_10_14_0_2_um_filter_39_12]PJE62148.1 MAG: hypothetical protein COU87_00855 [Candidatus Roizmanbacteria bacterium CG10_big_fil_rev_8_21_14_0_10_39_12]
MHVIPERNEMERGNLNIIEIASSLTLLAMTYYDMVLSKTGTGLYLSKSVNFYHIYAMTYCHLKNESEHL